MRWNITRYFEPLRDCIGIYYLELTKISLMLKYFSEMRSYSVSFFTRYKIKTLKIETAYLVPNFLVNKHIDVPNKNRGSSLEEEGFPIPA